MTNASRRRIRTRSPSSSERMQLTPLSVVTTRGEVPSGSVASQQVRCFGGAGPRAERDGSANTETGTWPATPSNASSGAFSRSSPLVLIASDPQ